MSLKLPGPSDPDKQRDLHPGGGTLRKVLSIVGILVLILIVGALGFYVWASVTTSRKLARVYQVHTMDFPIPFPLAAEEVARRKLTPAEADSVARDEALARGRHLITSRYPCIGCHGARLGGGTMVDAAPIGRILGPNLTAGRGGRTAGFQAADFDRIVRHGVKPGGLPALMPSVDFHHMSDQELSDIIVYLRAQPPVDSLVPAPTLGPLGKVLIATGKVQLSADLIAAEGAAHDALPPPTAPTIEFGRHLATTCTGCHGANLAGGPIPGGDPSWPPAANLTPDASGLGSWSFEQFEALLRQAKRPDGRKLLEPMAGVTVLARNMTDVEIEALWKFLRSIPAVPSRK
ncbi:MAG TPA: cytochrome c [Gemmatimonadales bacterium]|nr:cytochrome c [Gemmatimonadales bacterium]